MSDDLADQFLDQAQNALGTATHHVRAASALAEGETYTAEAHYHLATQAMLNALAASTLGTFRELVEIRSLLEAQYRDAQPVI